MATEIKVWGAGRTGLWSPNGPVDIPDEYEEVPVGDPYVTGHLKRRSDTVYLRMETTGRKGPSKHVAILAQREVVEAVRSEAERTAARRAQNRAAAAQRRRQKDERARAEALAELRRLFPAMRERAASQIITRAFQVGSGRVGRSQRR